MNVASGIFISREPVRIFKNLSVPKIKYVKPDTESRPALPAEHLAGYIYMTDKDPWTVGYLEEKFTSSDPWRYFTSDYEQTKYKRQLDVIIDRMPDPRKILEIGSAEGAQTLMLAECFPLARITGIEISVNAIKRAEENLRKYRDRVELANADIIKYVAMIEDSAYDVCIWSEQVYYIGAQISLNDTYLLLKSILDKLRPGGILVMANTVDLPDDIPESVVTRRPLIDCYYYLLSSLAAPALKAIYVENKLGRIYEYQIWAFER